MKRCAVRAVALLAVTSFCAAPGFAQEEQGSPADSPVGWVFRWLNFAIVLALIVWGLRKAAPMFRSKAEVIHNAILEGERAREEAEQRRQEVAEKIANLQNQIAEMRAAARRDAEAEAARIRELARSESEKIGRAAELEILAAERAARMELRAMGARLAVERAESLLRDQLTPAAQSNLFRGFVRELGEARN